MSSIRSKEEISDVGGIRTHTLWNLTELYDEAEREQVVGNSDGRR